MPAHDSKYKFVVLEDRPNSPEWLEFSEHFRNSHKDEVDLIRCGTPLKFVGDLKQLAESNLKPDLIVIDIMIPGVTNLSSIGLAVSTGDGFLAGLVFARDWLRRLDGGFEHIPILFWTALEKTPEIERNIEALAQIAPVGYVTKNTVDQWKDIETFLGACVFLKKTGGML